MRILAFMMGKAVTHPMYMDSIPRLWGIALVVSVGVWFLVRWNKCLRLVGFLVVALSLGYVANNLRNAFADRDLYVHPESDYHFLALSLAAVVLPVSAAIAAVCLPKRRFNGSRH